MTSAQRSAPRARAARAVTAEPAVAAPGDGRERLLRAMVLAAAQHGFAKASVARVLELSGASRSTFYGYFPNREECFLAAQREAAKRALRCVGADGESAVRLSVALEEALVRAAENPAAARLLLIETPGAAPAARAQSERFLARVEAAIETSIRPPHTPQLPASALLDGVAGVISARLLNDRGESLPSLKDELLRWGSSYVSSPWERRLSEGEWMRLGRALPPAEPGRGADVSLLPRGRSALEPAAGAASRRRRIVVATAQVVARKGFAASTVAEIVAAARVPRSAFYSQFSGKEAAFLAVQEEVLRETMAAAATKFVVGGSWQERVWNGLEALVYYVAERPDLARAGILEVAAAGTPAISRLHESALAFTLFLEEGFRLHPPLTDSRVLSEAIAFAIQGQMRRVVRNLGAGRLPEALPLCCHLALAPFIGPRASLELVSRKAEAAA